MDFQESDRFEIEVENIFLVGDNILRIDDGLFQNYKITFLWIWVGEDILDQF